MRLSAVAVLAACAVAAAPLGDLKLGEVVPDCAFKTMDGKDVKLGDFRGDKGKAVVVHFQSKNCPVAVKPDALKKLAEKYTQADSKAAFIAVFAYGHDGAEEIRKYVEENKLPWPCVFDADKKARDHFGAKQVNTTFVMGRDGKLGYRGGITYSGEETLDAAVKAALEGGEAPKSDRKFAG